MNDFPQIPGYKIKKILGKGGMGIVYLAIQETLDREVALKVTLSSLYDEDKTFLDRFVREARSAAMLQHPNIVTVFDAGVFENSSYMAMEYVPTGTLKDIDKDNLSHNQICRLFIGIAKGLGVAHKAGLVHRDIKPDNILIDNDGNPLVTDFGIVKTLNTNNHTLTRIGDTVGTPQYMSPEQIKAESLDGRSDIYSLGIVLYNFLEGHVPFADATPTAIYIKHVTEEPAPLSKKNSIFQSIIIKALQKFPDDRFASSIEFVDAVQSLMKVPHTHTPQKKVNKIDLSLAKTKMVHPVSEIPKHNRKLFNRAIIIVGALIFLIVGYLLYENFLPSTPKQTNKIIAKSQTEEKTIELVPSTIKPPKETVELDSTSTKNSHVEIQANDKIVLNVNKELKTTSEVSLQTNKVKTPSTEDKTIVLSEEIDNENIKIDTLSQLETDSKELIQTSEQLEIQIKSSKLIAPPIETNEEQINRLILSANKDYTNLRLLRPPENNAYTKYSKVLILDSENKEAKIGLLNIIIKYVGLTKTKSANNKLDEARKHINNAIKIRKDYDGKNYGKGTTFWQDESITLTKLQQEKKNINVKILQIEEQRVLVQQQRERQQEIKKKPVEIKPDYEAIYQEGISFTTQEKYDLAIVKFQQSADQGHAPSQNKLGVFYLKAYSVNKDYKQSIEWFTKAANQNNMRAQDNLGLMYFKGYGTRKSFDKSFYWYSKAANQGYADSQGILGALYEYGRGVKKSNYIAVQWYKKAAKQGNKFAIKKLRKRGISKYD